MAPKEIPLPPLSFAAHTVEADKVLVALNSSTQGLSSDQVASLQAQYGPNRLKPPPKPSIIKIVGRQFANAMSIVLIAAMAVSFGTQDWISGGVIAALIALNISVGAYTEWEAEKTVASLESVGAPQAVVVRDNNNVSVIAVEEVVPGDIIVLKNGDIVPADGRIIEMSNLECDEAFLTGESLPVSKQVEPVDTEACPVGDRICMVYSGSQVTRGRARCVITATAMSTEIGAIARALQSKAVRRETGWAAKMYRLKASLGIIDTTPLQIKLNKIAYVLLFAACVTAVVVVASTGFRDVPIGIATYAVAAAVSVLPASLIAVVSLTLARASVELSKENALVRRMDAVEALAGVENVCSDKTGTLTLGKMVVKRIWSVDGQAYNVADESVRELGRPESESIVGGQIKELALCIALCNQASRSEDGLWHGDPTEIALQKLAHNLAFGKPTHDVRQVFEHPFDSGVKRMSIAYIHEGRALCLLKGAVERVVDCCSQVAGADMDETAKYRILHEMDDLAGQGLRVLGFASRICELDDIDFLRTSTRAEFESRFTFQGLVGIYDPPRPESAGAVAECHAAGITPRMLTGDHPATAKAIALSIGILERAHSPTAVMTGAEFDALTDDQVDNLATLPLVVARCAPETKVRMVDAIHRRGQHTVMTGDGVNDSPALKRADVGVGMGTGSDVAKQSSNLVLADDNFATICRAIRKGRSVFKNLAKFLLYLLSGNVGELLVLLFGLAFRDQSGQAVFPLSPVSALWINTLTAGPPALALGLEPTSADAMTLPPDQFHEIFTFEFYADLFFYGILMAAQAMINFVIVLWGYFDGDLGDGCNDSLESCDAVFRARGTCFATLIIVMLIHSFQCKHATLGLFQVNLLDNKVLLWCVIVLVLSAFPVVHIPVINSRVFLIAPLKWEWGIVFGQLVLYLLASEAWKYSKRSMMSSPKRRM